LATSTQTLDFEKPIVELERQIDELKRLAGERRMSPFLLLSISLTLRITVRN
jgi:acetyl-CoA carboxylase alpha subunit